MAPKKATSKHAQVQADVSERTRAQSSSGTRTEVSEPAISSQGRLFVPPELTMTPHSMPQTPSTPGSGTGSCSMEVNTVQPFGYVRSIREKRKRNDDASLMNPPKKQRGICVGKSVGKEVAKLGRRLTIGWDKKNGVPVLAKGGYSACVKVIGAIVRSYVPMTVLSYMRHSKANLQIVINQLSVNYEFDVKNRPLYFWIQGRAADVYRRWKSKCGKEYENGGFQYPVPIEFAHRVEEWDWLCKDFETPEYKRKSKKMHDARTSIHRINHTSGPTPFIMHALTLKEQGHEYPHCEAYASAYEKRAPDLAENVRVAAKEAVMVVNDQAINSAIVDGTTSSGVIVDGTAPSGDVVAVQLERAIEIDVVQKIRGPSAGTCVRGFGTIPVRDAKKRGPAKGTYTPPNGDEEVPLGNEEVMQMLRESQEEVRLNREELRAADERSKALEKRLDEQACQQEATNRLLEQLLKSQGSSGQNSTSNIQISS